MLRSWSKKNILEYDTFFLTYDEPAKEERWNQVKSLIPHVKRVDGVKGFNLAHRRCAESTKSERVVIIDGDNSFLDELPKLIVSKKLIKTDYVLSYSSLNSINGLTYGNGGVKCWPKATLQNLKSHELKINQKGAVDFCFTVPYYQMPEVPTCSNIHLTPFQAFRSGYREGVKMCLNKGLVLNLVRDFCLESTIGKDNFFRFKTWCEVGRDIENGIWAIYGARLGALTILSKPEALEKIRDYDWFEDFWRESISDIGCIEDKVSELAWELKDKFDIVLNEVSSDESMFRKKVMLNPERNGLMFID